MIEIEHPVLAIDYGKSRMGLALSDALGMMAHPLETVHLKEEEPLEKITHWIQQRQIKTLLLGLPLLADGTEGKSALQVRFFANQLKKHLKKQALELPLHFIDESFSTVEAATKLQQSGKNSKKQKNIIDQAAAVEILNRWLEQQQNPYGLLPPPPEMD